jgi:hypothetical protein
MRLLAVLLIIFAAVVSLGFWTNHSIKASSDDLLKNIEKISAEIDKNQWDRACKQTTSLERTWDKQKKWWPTVMDHQEIDNIDFAMARVREYIAAKDVALAKGQLSELRMIVEHIPEKEAISIKNIL